MTCSANKMGYASHKCTAMHLFLWMGPSVIWLNVLHFEFLLSVKCIYVSLQFCLLGSPISDMNCCCSAQAMCFWNMVRSCASSPAIEWELWLCLSRGYNTLWAELERIKFHVSCAWLYNVTWVIFWTCMFPCMFCLHLVALTSGLCITKFCKGIN